MFHSFTVVLNDDHGIPEISQHLKGFYQLYIVALMQPYAGLIKNIKHAHKLGANLSCQANSLRFSATECLSLPVKREVIEPYIQQKVNTIDDFFEDLLPDFPLPFSQ
jgi:hypothetical protein